MSAQQGFAVWFTGITASGKSTVTRELVRMLNERGIYPVILESDIMRAILTPAPDYGRDERDRFYRQLADIGAMLTRQGLPVIFDATANRKAYRDHARSLIHRFVEVYVHCPVEIGGRRVRTTAAPSSAVSASCPGAT